MRSDAGSCDKFLINSNNPSPKKVFEDIPNEPLQQSSNNIIRKNNSKDPPKKNLVNIRRTFGEEFLDF